MKSDYRTNPYYRDACSLLDQVGDQLTARTPPPSDLPQKLDKIRDNLEMAIYQSGVEDDLALGHPVVIECRRYRSFVDQIEQMAKPKWVC